MIRDSVEIGQCRGLLIWIMASIDDKGQCRDWPVSRRANLDNG